MEGTVLSELPPDGRLIPTPKCTSSQPPSPSSAAQQPSPSKASTNAAPAPAPPASARATPNAHPPLTTATSPATACTGWKVVRVRVRALAAAAAMAATAVRRPAPHHPPPPPLHPQETSTSRPPTGARKATVSSALARGSSRVLAGGLIAMIPIIPRRFVRGMPGMGRARVPGLGLGLVVGVEVVSRRRCRRRLRRRGVSPLLLRPLRLWRVR